MCLFFLVQISLLNRIRKHISSKILKTETHSTTRHQKSKLSKIINNIYRIQNKDQCSFLMHRILESNYFISKKMAFHSDALSWLTLLRNRQSTQIDDIDGNTAASMSLMNNKSTNRWLDKEAADNFYNNQNDNNNNFGQNGNNNSRKTVLNSAATHLIKDEERDAEAEELMNERKRRRKVPFKNLLLRNAPPRNPSETVPVMSYGFEAIDTKNFQCSIAQMFVSRGSGTTTAMMRRQQQQQSNGAATSNSARTAFANVESQSQNTTNRINNNSSHGAGSASSVLRLSDDGFCVAQGLKSSSELDYLVHQLTTTQSSFVSSIDVSNSFALSTDQESECELMKKVMPLLFIRDDFPHLRVSVLIADNCELQDYDADFIARALREPKCSLVRVSLKNNLITEDGADRLKKAVKYNSRVMQIELNGCICTQRPNEKTKQILNQLEERLAANRKKAKTK